MPFFPLAGGEIVFMLLGFAIARWILRTWWAGELEDETLKRWLPRRPAPRPDDAEPMERPRPALRLIQGGRRDAPEPRAGGIARQPRR